MPELTDEEKRAMDSFDADFVSKLLATESPAVPHPTVSEADERQHIVKRMAGDEQPQERTW